MNQPQREVLSALIGSRLRKIGRVADLFLMTFGRLRDVPAMRGGTCQVGQWAIHIQCAWRFARKSELVVGITDMHYYAADGSDFDWEKDGESRFDRIARRLNREFDAVPEFVTDVMCDDVGGFSLLLTSGMKFDVFPCVASSSPGFEFWRFFEPDSENDHYVVQTIEE